MRLHVLAAAPRVTFKVPALHGAASPAPSHPDRISQPRAQPPSSARFWQAKQASSASPALSRRPRGSTIRRTPSHSPAGDVLDRNPPPLSSYSTTVAAQPSGQPGQASVRQLLPLHDDCDPTARRLDPTDARRRGDPLALHQTRRPLHIRDIEAGGRTLPWDRCKKDPAIVQSCNCSTPVTSLLGYPRFPLLCLRCTTERQHWGKRLVSTPHGQLLDSYTKGDARLDRKDNTRAATGNWKRRGSAEGDTLVEERIHTTIVAREAHSTTRSQKRAQLD